MSMFLEEATGARYARDAGVRAANGQFPDGMAAEPCYGCGSQANVPTASEIATAIRHQERNEAFDRASARVVRTVSEAYAKEFNR